jgi:hypothetical protein
MPEEGWEFYILDPTNIQTIGKTQDVYNEMYNSAFNKLIQQLCIPDPNEFLESDKHCTFLYYIDCKGENDVIKLDKDYEYKFLKSIFLDKKANIIKKTIYKYYNLHGIYVKSMYKDDSSYFIELEKKALGVVN